MKTTGLASSKAKGTQTSRFTLETLENRTLLNADTIIYGIADMFYSEDALAQSDSITEHEDHHDLESTYLDPMPALSGGYTLFLDFEPATVYSRSGDFWLRQDSITIPGYDLSSYGWAGYEQESIEHILGFVSEDYAAYNVSVTATKPTTGQYTTIYVGGTADWYQTNSNIIGIASYDVGNRDASNYGFAFTEELSTYKSYAGSSVLKFSEYVANLISHEAAHTFGANHVDDPKYMMNPYLSTTYRTSGFGQGAIPDSTSSQDTQNLLGLNLGYKNSSDDYGDTASDPERISISSSASTTINGILEHITDTDAFKFTASASGIFTADIDTTIYGNLDSTLTIYDAAGRIIHSNNNTTQGKDSLISFEITQGQEYTVLVSSANRETSGTYQLTLTAPAGTPEISVSDSSAVADDSYIDFGNIYISDTTSHTITITNSGSDTLTINNIVTSGNFDYTREAGIINIPAGDSTIITVGFTPEYTGVISGQVVIYSNDSDNAVKTVNITGTGIANTPDIEVSQSTRNSGAFDLGGTSCDINGSGYITISNSGRATLQISSITVSGDFTVDNKPISIEAGSSKKVYINYSSQEARTLTGEITIQSNDPDESVLTYDITAQVFDSEQPISGGTITINESDNLNDGTTYGGELEAGQINTIDLWTITNNSDEELVINTSSTDNTAFTVASTITVAAGETMTITAQFAALLPYSYSTEIVLTVNDEMLTAPLTLSIDSYAVFGNRTKYVFRDNDSDQVTVSLTKATGKIFLGNDGQPDIRKIEIDEITGYSNLTIKTQRGSYTTLGELTAQGDFSAINAPSTNLSGNMIIDGEVSKLVLNEIEADSQIDYATAVRGGTLQFDNNAGTINIDGMLKNLKVTSELSGNIQVNGNINMVNAGEISLATINAAGYIKTIRANNIDNSEIYASDSITNAVVKYDMTDSVISAGFSPVYGSSSAQAIIQNVLISNTFSGSIISSGITPDNGEFIDGTSNNLTGSIGKVKLGQIADSNDIFGIVASGDIRQIIIGRDKYTTDHQENNFIIRENMV